MTLATGSSGKKPELDIYEAWVAAGGCKISCNQRVTHSMTQLAGGGEKMSGRPITIIGSAFRTTRRGLIL